jgi:hypothetical protein
MSSSYVSLLELLEIEMQQHSPVKRECNALVANSAISISSEHS